MLMAINSTVHHYYFPPLFLPTVHKSLIFTMLMAMDDGRKNKKQRFNEGYSK